MLQCRYHRLKRNVLSQFLKMFTDGAVRQLSGKEFQSVGAATEKRRAAMSMLCGERKENIVLMIVTNSTDCMDCMHTVCIDKKLHRNNCWHKNWQGIRRPKTFRSFCRPIEGRRLSWPSWLVTYRDGLPAHRWSLILVLTRSDIVHLHWSRPTRYH